MPNKRTGTRPLTKRQKKLAEGVARGLTIKDAGARAGYPSKQSAHRAFQVIKLRFHPALEAKGYNVDQVLTEIFEKIREKMEAKETVFFNHQGIVMETREIIPHDTQLNAAREMSRFLGIIGNGHDDGVSGAARPAGPTVNLVFTDPRTAALFAENLSRVGRYSGRPALDVRRLDEDQGRTGPTGALQAGPRRPYMEVVHKLWKREPILFIEKSRSMMISWVTTGLVTHQIMTHQPAKAVLWAQDQDRAVILRDYAWTLWEQQDDRLKALYPVLRPKERQAFDRLEFARGGSIVALPGKDPK